MEVKHSTYLVTIIIQKYAVVETGRLLGAYVNTELTINEDGKGKANVKTDKGIKKFDIQITDLSYDKVDLEIYENGQLIKHITDISELNVDVYEGQSIAIPLVEVAIISLLLAILLIVVIREAIIVNGVLWRAASLVIEAVCAVVTRRNDYSRWYLAKLDTSYQEVYLSPSAISKDAAVNALRTKQSVYTYSYVDALLVAEEAYGDVIGPEVDSVLKSGYIYYQHFHSDPRTYSPAHSWFGLPITK